MAAQPSAAAVVVGVADVTAAVLAAARMQQEEAPEAPQETESIQTQSSTDEVARAARGTAAESSAVAARLGGKSSYDVHGSSVGDVDGVEPSHAFAEGGLSMSLALCACVQRDILVHAIFRSYISDWKEKHDRYSTCLKMKPDEIRIGPICCSFHKTENSFGWFAWRPPEEHDQGDTKDTWDQGEHGNNIIAN